MRSEVTPEVEIEVGPLRRRMHVALGGLLGDAVIGVRAARLGLGRRHGPAVAVERHRAGVDQPRDLVFHAQLENIEGAFDVGPKSVDGVGKRADDRDLTGDIADCVQSAREGRFHLRRHRHVATQKLGSLPARPRAGRWTRCPPPITACPSASRRRHRWEPIKPAPPVTRILISHAPSACNPGTRGHIVPRTDQRRSCLPRWRTPMHSAADCIGSSHRASILPHQWLRFAALRSRHLVNADPAAINCAS